MLDFDTILHALAFVDFREVLYLVASGASILGLVLTRRVLRVVSTPDRCLKELAEAYYCLRAQPLPSTSLAVAPVSSHAQIERDIQRICDARTIVKHLLEAIAGVEFDHTNNHFIEIARGLEKRGEAATAKWFYEHAEWLHSNGKPLHKGDLERCRRGLEACYCALWQVERIKKRRAWRESALLESAGVYTRCLMTSLTFNSRVAKQMIFRSKHTAMVVYRR